MREQYILNVKNTDKLKEGLLRFGNQFNRFVFLDSNTFTCKNLSEYTYYEYDFLAAFSVRDELKTGSFSDLASFTKKTDDWLFGFLSYDLKNNIEDLTSQNTDELEFPDIFFFIPEIVITGKNNQVTFHFSRKQNSIEEIESIIAQIQQADIQSIDSNQSNIEIHSRFSKQEYIEIVKKLKHHIQLGDIYEVNFCQEFYFTKSINPLETFLKLKNISPTPFSCYIKFDDKYLICASPERFIKKQRNKIISQPIKGTIKRGKTSEEDEILKNQLLNDPKERSENVMIVDLVRNDLSRTAKIGSVKVEELYGIYTFPQVHQMISTVISEVDEKTDIIEVIKNAFPMGSMTGAPKIRAMQLIEENERTKRGLYSGSVGYITPDKNFDFNVVIRSILYNQTKNYVSFTVGGAITSLSDPEKEYEECLLKAQAITKLFNI